MGGAHAIRPFYGLIHPNVDRLSGLAGSVHRDAVEIVREHIVYLQCTVQEGDLASRIRTSAADAACARPVSNHGKRRPTSLASAFES